MRIIIEVPATTHVKTYTEPTAEGAVDAGAALESLPGPADTISGQVRGGELLEVIDGGGPPEDLIEAAQEEAPTDIEGEIDDSDAGPAPDPQTGSPQIEYYRDEGGAERWRAAPEEGEVTEET